MSRGQRWHAAAVAALVVVVSTLGSGPARGYLRPGVYELISVSSGGQQANDASSGVDGHSSLAMTPDGRFVVFASTATNLTSGGAKTGISAVDGEQLFVRDRVRHTTVLVSAPPVPADGKAQVCLDASDPAISDNGRYVVFSSSCQNLTPGQVDPTLSKDVFLHDMRTDSITRVSVAADGGLANGSSTEPTISANGRVVAFTSTSTNLAPMPCADDAYATAMCQVHNAVGGVATHVFVRDLATKKTTLVSQAMGGGAADGNSNEPSVSPDGRFVAFTSSADDLVSGDVNVCSLSLLDLPSCPDVFLRDLQKNRTELISVSLNGGPGNNMSGRTGNRRTMAISADDRFVAFNSHATDLVPNASVGDSTYVRDRRLGRTTRVSVDSSGQSGSGAPFSLSRNGRYVAMDATASQYQCQDSQRPGLITVHDNLTGALDVVGWITADGKPNNCKQYYNTYGGPISSNGRYVALFSTASNFVNGDTNEKSDAFVADRGTDLAVGALVRSGALSVAGEPGFRSSGLLHRVDDAADVGETQSDIGLDLIGASLAYRQATSDLFVRIQVAKMPLFALASPFVRYGVNFSVGGADYALRIGKSVGGATFELLRRTGPTWIRVCDVAGGYGTTGQEVVAVIPLAAIGAQDGAKLTNLRADSEVAAGPTTSIVDEIRL